MNNIVRKRLEIIAKLIIGFGLIIFLVVYVEPKNILETFNSADKIYIFFAFLLMPLNLFLQFSKWKILCRKYFGISDNKSIWISIFYGKSGGIFTPMKSGEYLARALPFKNIKVLDVIIATAVDKMIPMLFILYIGGSFFIIFYMNMIGYSTSTKLLSILIYLILVILPLLLLFSSSNYFIKLRARLKRIQFLQKFFEKVSFIRELDRITFIKVTLLSLLFHLTFTSQMALLLSGYSGIDNFFLFFFVANLVIFTQVIIPPIALGELGVREGATIFFMQHFGYTAAVGFNSALSLFSINLLLPAMVGFIMLFRRNN